MKKSRYTPEQVAFGLRPPEEGTPVAEVRRKLDISGANLISLQEEVPKHGGGGGVQATGLRGGEPQAPATGDGPQLG